MARLRVYGGTAREDEKSLCKSCRSSHIWIDALGEHTVCTHGAETTRIAGKVTSCSQFDSVETASKWEMEKIAWSLRMSGSGTPMGFKPPEKIED